VNEIAASISSPAVQSIFAIQAQVAGNLPQLHAVARKLYQRWMEGLVADCEKIVR
jgi:hypothetical protein